MNTLDDLVFAKQAGIRVDAADFARILTYENKHRDIAACHECGVSSGEQHKTECGRSSVLALPNWFEVLADRAKQELSEADKAFLRDCGIRCTL
jgi:hypothetical protein